MDFLISFSLLISDLFALGCRKNMHDFNPFKFVETFDFHSIFSITDVLGNSLYSVLVRCRICHLGQFLLYLFALFCSY